MSLNSAVHHHRVKHFDQLLARELSLIEREHSQNLIMHQKLENSIRRANNQSSINSRNKVSIPFDNIYNEQNESLDYHKISINGNNNFNQKRRFSNRSISSISQNQTIIDQTNHFSDDASSYTSFRHRRFCTKSHCLPPILKANISDRHGRDSKNIQWMTNIEIENLTEPFTILNEDLLKPKLPELTPIQRQVRSFIETLPTYKGTQHGFDSFAPASLYSNRAPFAIR